LDVLKLWGKMLLRLRECRNLPLAITFATSKDLSEAHLSSEAIEGIANFLNSLDHTGAVMVLREEHGVVKGSLRTTRDDIDVSKFAQFFGGGGHKKAAGFSLSGKIVETSTGYQVL